MSAGIGSIPISQLLPAALRERWGRKTVMGERVETQIARMKDKTEQRSRQDGKTETDEFGLIDKNGTIADSN